MQRAVRSVPGEDSEHTGPKVGEQGVSVAQKPCVPGMIRQDPRGRWEPDRLGLRVFIFIVLGSCCEF